MWVNEIDGMKCLKESTPECRRNKRGKLFFLAFQNTLPTSNLICCLHSLQRLCLPGHKVILFFLFCAWFLFWFDAPVNSSIMHLLFLVPMKCCLPVCLVWQTLKSIKVQFYYNCLFLSMGLLKYIANQYRFHIGLPAEQGWKGHYRNMDQRGFVCIFVSVCTFNLQWVSW